jgi:hypothetical protein
MPAVKQASRSTAEAFAVSARIGVRGASCSASMALMRRVASNAVHARHVQVHEHAIVRRAGRTGGKK